MGLSASEGGQWQNWEADARFGDQGWDPSSAMQAAQLQGQMSVMSSSVWKSLMRTQNKNSREGCLQCFVMKINPFLILLLKGKKVCSFVGLLTLSKCCH